MDFETNLSIIQVMLKQEESGYTVQDFLRHLPKQSPFGQPVDATARSTIAEWCIKIMDVCHYRRETAAIAMSMLDRFVSTTDGHGALLDRRDYQLAALSAVYSAVKVHEQQALAPHLVAKLSHGTSTKEDIENMEMRILMALKWRVNPPTAMDFVRKFLELVPACALDEKSRQIVLELAQLQTDSIIPSYEFCMQKSSCIAVASLLNAIESIADVGLSSYIESLISRAVDYDNIFSVDIRDQLYASISSRTVSDIQVPALRKQYYGITYKAVSGSTYTSSPRTVQLS